MDVEKPEAQQVTSTEKKTKPKDPGRVAAGRKPVEFNRWVREEPKRERKKEAKLE